MGMIGWRRSSAALLTLFFGVACTGDFKPYNELIGFRVLGVRAEPPTVPPNASTKLSVLTFIGAPEMGTEVEYAWSWCPFTAGGDLAFKCVVTREQLQAGVDAAVGMGVL